MQQPSPVGSGSGHGKVKRAYEPLPEAREVASGIWKITMPIPFPLRSVNVYALVGTDGWTLIDTGIGTPDAREAFHAGLQRTGLRIDTLRAIVLSHLHPDHVGLSGELQEQSGAAVYMHPIDEANLQIFWNGDHPRTFSQAADFFKQHGMPSTDHWSEGVPQEQMQRIIHVPPHEAITLVEDGQTLDLVGERYRVIWTPGHSDGHICLFRERDGVFLAADHVLPRITPNIGLYSEHDRSNPLGDYLHSLAKVSTLPASIVLPGHGEPFKDLALRTREITEHHAEREKQILTLLDQHPQHAYHLSEQLFGQRFKNKDAQRMAVAETLAHLEHLRLGGQVEQQHTTGGLILYAAV